VQGVQKRSDRADRYVADSILALKVMPPRPRRDVIARPRLDRRFTRQSDVPVVVVEAPAGYGKTLLLAQWRRAAMAEGAAAAWLTLDAQDDERRLLEGVVLAIRQATGRSDFALGVEWAASEADWFRRAAATILADWSRLARPVVLVLDDFDRLPDTGAREIGRYLLANMPSNGRVLVGVRAIENRPWVMELQAYGQLAIVGRGDLAFTLEESMAFLQQRMAGSLSNDHAARIHERTGGWPIGLELFVATVTETNDPGAALTAIQDGSRNLAGYLIESATAAWPQDMKTFLVEISILAHLNADLCQAVTARPDSAAILAELRTRSALVLDGEDDDWFRLHHLAVEHLREEAGRLPEEHRKRLHHRAADWLKTHGFWEDAATHAVEAGDSKLAFDCIERSLNAILAAGKFDVVDHWLKRLPPEEIGRRRRLRLAVAIRHAIMGAPQYVDLIEDFASDADPRLRFMAAMVHALYAGHTDDPDAGRRALAEWRETPCSNDPVMLRGYYNLRRWLDPLEGLPQKPRPWGEGASPLYGRAALGGSITLHQAGVVHLRNGQPLLAGRRLAPGLARFEAALGRRSPPAVLIAVTLAAAAAEQDEFAQIRMLLADRLDLLDPGVLPDALAMGYVAAAALAQSDGQFDRALDLLELLLGRAKARGLVRIQALATFELVKFHTAAGRIEPCDRLIADLRTIAAAAEARESLNAPSMRLHLELAEARACWVRRDAAGALQKAEAAAMLAVATGARRLEFEARFLRVAAQHELTGETPDDLGELASLAETLGLKRLLREANAVLQPALRRLLQARTQDEGEEIVWDAPAPAKAPKPVNADASAMLTAREAQVLLLLSRGLSNKEIANALDIGDGTIKWHLKNLFLKFDATDRKHLVARARLLGLVEAY
jgi:LuxR family maltose regulon positive regulatory protein